MTIDINNRPGPMAQRGPEQTAAEKPSTRPKAEREREAAIDSVNISPDAHSLRRLQTKLEQQDSFDAVRVEQIRDAISNGQYPIDNERLAENFLELESKL